MNDIISQKNGISFYHRVLTFRQSVRGPQVPKKKKKQQKEQSHIACKMLFQNNKSQ